MQTFSDDLYLVYYTDIHMTEYLKFVKITYLKCDFFVNGISKQCTTIVELLILFYILIIKNYILY